mgnify:CR=1 FL=1
MAEQVDDMATKAHALNNLGSVIADAGQPEASLPFLERALVIREKTLGRDHPAVASTLHNLAATHLDLGHVERVLADVAGKGISAALLVSNLQARVQILAETPEKLDDLVERLFVVASRLLEQQ